MSPKTRANEDDVSPKPTYLSPPSQSICPNCNVQLYYYPPSEIANVHNPITYTCAACNHTFTPTSPEDSVTDNMSKLSISKTYYDILGVETTATTEEIARAYRKKSLKCHPDRTKGREKEWEELARAYETLGDKRKRKWYDMELEKGTTGLDNAEDPTAPIKLDPEKFFQDIFGGERFYDLIGMSSVGKAVGEAMHNPSSNEQELEKSAAEKAEEQAKETLERSERVRMLVENLSYKLDIYALDEDIDGRMDRWRARCKAEADELKNERFGAEILKAVGYVYRIKATTHPLRSRSSWSGAFNARLASWGSTYNTFSSVFSTVRKAYTVKSAFVALQAAESDPKITPEQKQVLEEKAAKVAIEALWSGVRLEIYDVLKEVCDIVLDAKTLTTEHCLDRITALECLGVAFESVKADVVSEEVVNGEHA